MLVNDAEAAAGTADAGMVTATVLARRDGAERTRAEHRGSRRRW